MRVVEVEAEEREHRKESTMIKPYTGDLEAATLANEDFRRVLFTGAHAQLVVMCLRPGEEIGEETHPATDQFFHIEEGTARFVFDGGNEHLAYAGDAVVIPAGTRHNVVNAATHGWLRLNTLYAPPQHPAGTVQHTKAEALQAEHV